MEQKDAPAPSQTGSNAIAARLRHAILNGKYSYNSKLPPERELAEFFSASRGTVRAALRQLEDTGLLARRVGSGTYVVHQFEHIHVEDETGLKDNIVESTSPLELIETRLALEPYMARLAVVNATTLDLQRMRKIVEELENCGDDSECFSRYDEAFHLCLAELSHNRLISFLYGKINEIRSQAQWNVVKRSILKRENIATYNSEHRALYEALVQRDMDTARSVIRKHLEHARKDLLNVQAD